MTTTSERSSFIRPDGKEKVTGAGRYAADLNLTGQLHAKFRYADHPHARIVNIDTSDPAIATAYETAVGTHLAAREQLCRSTGIPYLRLSSDSDGIEDDVLRL